MIYITAGHEKGIGHEIFLKTYIMLTPKEREQIVFIGDEHIFKQEIRLLSLPTSHFSSLKFYPISSENNHQPLTLNSLFDALSFLKHDPRGVLITLPTSKDQLEGSLGYTEFFRKQFALPQLSMNFISSKGDPILLLTDHIPLKNVVKELTPENIFLKTNESISGFKTYFNLNFEEVVFAGINPHAGENNLLGDDEAAIRGAIQKLQVKYPQVIFTGPIPGDTIHMHQNHNKKLIVYSYHDQGLASYKMVNQLIGANITMGLPFLRMSVDHGTAFNLYHKNIANPMGLYFVLKKSLEVLNYVYHQ